MQKSVTNDNFVQMMMEKISRDLYLNRLVEGIGNGLIKIVTGMRRCGKSYLLFQLFTDYLLSHGVDRDHIIMVNLEDLDNRPLRDPVALLRHVRSLVPGDGERCYVLLDEVQLVTDFVEVLNSLLRTPGVETFVTGSNSRFLSTDIATEFRGRGYVVEMHPLSFAEYCSATSLDSSAAWKEYYTYGGLPQVAGMTGHTARVQYLQTLMQTVYLADVRDRHHIADDSELEELLLMLASAIGSPCNPAKLANTYKSVKHVDIDARVLSQYLSHLQDAFIVERAMRYDIKGKRYINTLSKYYFSDMGLRNALLNFRQLEENHIMENVIYNELRVRGYQVDVGYVDARTAQQRRSYEVDFVANQGDRRYYIQSAWAMPTDEKLRQECQSLLNIRDAFAKVIVVGNDIMPYYTADGIRIIGLKDFLLHDDALNG